MIDRIIEIRKSSGLSQEEFADRLGLSRNFINRAENGKKNFSDRTISSICKEFGYNEDWLRSGILPKKPLDKLSTYLGQIDKGNDEFIKDLIIAYMELDPDSKKALQVLTEKMYKSRKERGL